MHETAVAALPFQFNIPDKNAAFLDVLQQGKIAVFMYLFDLGNTLKNFGNLRKTFFGSNSCKSRVCDRPLDLFHNPE